MTRAGVDASASRTAAPKARHTNGNSGISSEMTTPSDHKEAVERLTKFLDFQTQYAGGITVGHYMKDCPEDHISYADLRTLLSRIEELEGERDYFRDECKNAQAYWRIETQHAEQAESALTAERERAEALEKALEAIEGDSTDPGARDVARAALNPTARRA